MSWHRADGRLVVFADVPVGSTAIVRLPDPDWREVEVGSGKHRFECAFRTVADDPKPPAPPHPLGLPPETTSGVFED